MTNPRIAIPMPHSTDEEYAQRSVRQYENAIEMAAGEPVRIPLDETPAEVMRLIERCDGVVLPGSPADVDPAKFNQPRHPKTEDADTKRDTVDELLLQDAYNMRKPILGICYGLQILNVYRCGTLVQHIESAVKHDAGRKVPIAHSVEIDPGSRLRAILHNRVASQEANPESLTREGNIILPVNSSHHQAADLVGDGLRVSARCSQDGIIEALEGVSPDHFVLAVQWHPERSLQVEGEGDAAARAIFHAFTEAARQ